MSSTIKISYQVLPQDLEDLHKTSSEKETQSFNTSSELAAWLQVQQLSGRRIAIVEMLVVEARDEFISKVVELRQRLGHLKGVAELLSEEASEANLEEDTSDYEHTLALIGEALMQSEEDLDELVPYDKYSTPDPSTWKR